MLTTSQTLIVIATINAVRPIAAPFLNRVPRDLIIRRFYPSRGPSNLTEVVVANLTENVVVSPSYHYFGTRWRSN